ncbi:MAG: sigma-70 family RNA polymerase sigma factor [Clostridia bacterium]|nr:sigma-70 family RNA polymerase sigma factor [Clostridia bacterium]
MKMIEKYREQFYRMAYTYMKSEHDASEVLQDSIGKAYENLDQLRDDAYMKTWFVRVLMNTAINGLNQKKRLQPDKNIESTFDENHLQSGHENAAVNKMDLMAALDILNEQERAIVQLRFFEDYKLEEVSKAVELPLNTTKTILYRALKKMRQSLAITAVILLIVFSSLTVAINLSPAFANSLLEVPILGHIVEVLRFVDGSASGGILTDGTDIKSIDVIEKGAVERFIIHFSQDDQAQENTNAYQIRKYGIPNIVQFDIGGARMISASEDFEAIRALDGVKDVYTLMTLDDSLIRFNVAFEAAIDVEITEISDPAGLMVTLTEHEMETLVGEIYVVCSDAYPRSESFGHMEEELFWLVKEGVLADYRIIKDPDGRFTYEFGRFETEVAAQEWMNGIQGKVSFVLFVEPRPL